jgi:hypothetical protein
MDVPIISKSRYLDGIQCHKLLWSRYHEAELFPPVDDATGARFEQGKAVGKYARNLYRDGIEVVGDYRDFPALIGRTASMLGSRKPLFEPAFAFGQAYARIDVLLPVEHNAWDLIEVKSAGEVKDTHIDDVALQDYVCRGAGLDIRRCCVMHINKEYVRFGDVDPGGLLTMADVTTEVRMKSPQVSRNLDLFNSVITQVKRPSLLVGPHCDTPYECPLRDRCWGVLPRHHVFTLSRLPKSHAAELLRLGMASLCDVPEEFLQTERRNVQVKAVRTGEVQVDNQRIGEFLDSLVYPLYFIDFETVHPAVPLYDGTRPFEHVPFQCSLHVQRNAGEAPEHHMFLADTKEDPRSRLIGFLRAHIGPVGSVIAYNARFEVTVLSRFYDLLPQTREWGEGIAGRVVDLYALFSTFASYHPEQRGGASMKDVLPLLCGITYDGMPIGDGEAAGREFIRVTFGDVPPEEKQQILGQLRKYCGLDTFGMVKIVESLRRLTSRVP